MTAIRLIDSHVHFWDPAAVPLSWMRALPAIDRRFYPVDLDADRGDVEIDAIVFVETNVDDDRHVEEADWVTKLATGDPRIQAIVAHAPLERGIAARADLEALAARPLVRAIRRLIQGQDAAALCGSADFQAGIGLLPGFGFHFELCLLHDQLAPVLDLVRALPDVHFVLDHIAKPGIKAGLREPWWQEIAALAALANVDCKISGVATEADHGGWTEVELRPYLDRVLEVFGPDRVLFGSDWPVMRLAIAYPRWVEIVRTAVAHWPEADQAKLFSENARRIYRL